MWASTTSFQRLLFVHKISVVTKSVTGSGFGLYRLAKGWIIIISKLTRQIKNFIPVATWGTNLGSYQCNLFVLSRRIDAGKTQPVDKEYLIRNRIKYNSLLILAIVRENSIGVSTVGLQNYCKVQSTWQQKFYCAGYRDMFLPRDADLLHANLYKISTWLVPQYVAYSLMLRCKIEWLLRGNYDKTWVDCCKVKLL